MSNNPRETLSLFSLSIIDRHIARHVLANVTITLLVLVALRALFTLLDEADKIGQGNYQFADSLYYVLLLVPTRCYEFFPMSVLIGSLSALGLLASQNELTAMRAAGVRTGQILMSAIKATMMLLVLALLFGEWIAPQTAKVAQSHRAAALSGGSVADSKSGTWVRSGPHFVYIAELVDGERLNGVRVLTLNSEQRLAKLITARSATFKNGGWNLTDAVEITNTANGLSRQVHQSYQWSGELNPDYIDVLTVKPEQLNMLALYRYQQYLQSNQLESSSYALEFWRKVFLPATLVVMTLLASAFVFGPMRSVSIGARLMTGIVTGFGFYLTNQFFGPISLVYQLPPLLGAAMPLAVFAGVAMFLLRRFS